MKSMFDQPPPTRIYLDTYGGFLIHCGFTAMGVPAAGDSHPLHGELPNAPYGGLVGWSGRARRVLGSAAVSVHGRLQPQLSRRAAVKLYAGSTLFTIEFAVTNLKHTPME